MQSWSSNGALHEFAFCHFDHGFLKRADLVAGWGSAGKGETSCFSFKLIGSARKVVGAGGGGSGFMKAGKIYMFSLSLPPGLWVEILTQRGKKREVKR